MSDSPPHWSRPPASVTFVARQYLRGLTALFTALLVAVFLILVGLSAPAGTVPVADFVRSHPVASAVSATFLLTLTIASLALTRREDPTAGDAVHPGDGQHSWYTPALVAVGGASTLSLGLIALLVFMLITHPLWCWSWVCVPPVPVLQTAGVHDANMELYPIGVQSSSFVLAASPSSYTPTMLPGGTTSDVAAAMTGLSSSPTAAYRLVIGIHSLRTSSNYNILIDEVALLVDQVVPSPYPLNVFVRGANEVSQAEPYRAIYVGTPSGTALLARFLDPAHAPVQLTSGEADSLALEVDSVVPADLRVRVEITYRVAGETTQHSLVLPTTFAVVFSNATNWHPYELAGSGLIPVP